MSGTLGSAFLAARMDEPNLIVTDMGGTSFDVSVIRGGTPGLRETSFIERFEIALPMVYVDSIGAGGGSVAWIDEAGGLQVGPHSAGADPGPACYARGGAEPTVTDADVVLGIIDPDTFLHGTLKLDRTAAESAIRRIASRLGLAVHEAAAGINRIVDNKMADLLRRMSVMRGLDPREFVCFAYGGMGPVHAAAIARDVGVKKLIVPLPHTAAVWSAFGAMVADIVHVYQQWQTMRMPADPAAITAVFDALGAQGRATLLAEGFGLDQIELRRFLRMKYAVQVFDIEVPLTAAGPLSAAGVHALADRFGQIYADLNGEASGHPEGGIEITGFVVRARGLTDAPKLSRVQSAVSTDWTARSVYWTETGAFVDTPVLRLAGGRLDERLEGPLLIELPIRSSSCGRANRRTSTTSAAW